MITSYRAVARPAVMDALYARMTPQWWDVVDAKCSAAGKTLAEFIGSAAVAQDRFQDVDLMEVTA